MRASDSPRHTRRPVGNGNTLGMKQFLSNFLHPQPSSPSCLPLERVREGEVGGGGGGGRETEREREGKEGGWEGERDRERQTDRQRERERERARSIDR